ncbi:mechanosensitive ion channel family protein [Desertibaculum subflavum]|uniref:mechanosensitive ion channel family protein n=1 Tax=Desertibaculum subflavum TaxID=2268458 RepID=UPI000E6659E9
MQQIENLLAYLPDWALSLGTIALAIFLGWALHSLVFRWIRRLAGEGTVLRLVVERVRGPTRLAMIMLAVALAATVAPLTDRQAGVIRQINLVAIIALAGWAALTVVQVLAAVHLRRFQIDVADNLLARKHVTQFRILQRVAGTIIVVITAGAALMTFGGVRQYGVSLLASAGAAGIVVGLALQPLLKNLIAGVQLALTQPIRIDDALIVEGEWGNVEEITSTYVVLRLWDWRRLILPLSYFIERPFQNWTREGSELIGVVYFYVDHTLPVGALRRKLDDVLHASALWDQRVGVVQVTDFKEMVMEVRILASASSAGRAFDLRCEVREKIIDWIQAEHPTALPRRRQDIVSIPAPDHAKPGITSRPNRSSERRPISSERSPQTNERAR